MIRRPFNSTEIVILAYAAAVSVIVVAGGASKPWIYLAYHAAVVGMISMVAHAERRYGGRFWSFVRCWLPIYVILASFREMHYLIPEVHPFDDHALDAALMRADRAIFGDVVGFLRKIWWRPFVEVLHYCYWLYFPMPLALLILLRRQGRAADFRRAATTLLCAFYLGYLAYVAFPAVGPHHFEARAPELNGVLLGGWLHRTLLELEWTMPDAFPSLHTAIAALTLVLCWKLSRRLFWILLAPATGLILATFVLRYHYVVDVFAGLVLVPIAYALGTWLSKEKGPEVSTPGPS